MVSCCLSWEAIKQVSRMDQIDQMESNGLHSTKPCQMVKWCLVAWALRSYSKWVEWIKSIKWSRVDSIRLSLVKWSNGVLLHQHSGFKASESNGSNRSNGVELNSIRLSLVKWSNGVLLHQLRGCKASESSGSNRSNGVEWTPFH